MAGAFREPTLFDSGSFRDPSGRVLVRDGRIFRAVSADKAEEAMELFQAPFFVSGMGSSIVHTSVPDDLEDVRGGLEPHFTLLLEHERIDPITYPYEWPFALLKRAAEFHLELHIEALENGFDLSDSSAFNIQYVGTKPIFIDTLSFKKYREGNYWVGYKQFCEQFLAPLLLTATRGVPYNDWYKGAVNGIDLPSIAKLLPLKARFSLQAQMHVFMHAKLIGRVQSHKADLAASGRKALPISSLKGLLRSMLLYVRSLRPKGLGGTYWKEYEFANSYSAEDVTLKRNAVSEFAASRRPKLVLDIGCNSGDFSELCLTSGASSVVGVDFDQGALEAAVTRADEKNLSFLPLYQDLTNPSPSAGWASSERKSITERVRPDAIVALAVLHHLVVGKNIPMEAAIGWMVDLAPSGLLEFVPKQDPMLKGMLAHRADIFADYTEEAFRRELSARARITSEVQSSASG